MKGLVERHPVGRWLFNFLLILAAFGLLYFLNAGNAENNRQARYDFCVEVEQVRSYAREAAQRGLKSIPTIAYYRTHPAERRRAVRDIKRQVDFFSPPLDCKEFSKS